MDSPGQLSDADLRKNLMEHGFNAGPVTPTTRSIYERKLVKLQSGESLVSATQVEEQFEYEQELESDQVDSVEVIQQARSEISTPSPSKDSSYMYSPYGRSYCASDRNMHRRSLRRDWKDDDNHVETYTVTSTKTTKNLTKPSSSSVKPAPKSSFWRYVIYLLIVLILIGLLIYLYMEPTQIKRLPFVGQTS